MDFGQGTVVLAGRRFERPGELVARYCGLRWSGGAPETWAHRFYDKVPPSDPDRIDTTDVLAAAALHPGLSQRDLTFFFDRGPELEHWLRAVGHTPLHQADEPTLRALDT